ncbi:MAG: MBL fold metallo-hydrolase [Muribaculaceae bacterium]|nr:MBL fold metallo-hydrolase [Muribaculaceae bacterium]
MKIVKFGFSLFGINTYLVYDPSTLKCAVIDPGMFDKEEEDAMENFIRKNSLEVTHIINTHLHIDHVVGIGFLKRKYNAPLYAHKDDEFLASRVGEQARMFGLPAKVEDVAIDYYLSPGETIKIGDGELKVIHVPGHSPGSVALYDEKDGFVITGDALFAGSVGRTDLPGGNMSTLLLSIKNGLLALPPSTIVYPGHGPATTIGQEIRMNPYLKQSSF